MRLRTKKMIDEVSGYDLTGFHVLDLLLRYSELRQRPSQRLSGRSEPGCNVESPRHQIQGATEPSSHGPMAMA